jgi:quercetin dioxygenase-like cupin family protein
MKSFWILTAMMAAATATAMAQVVTHVDSEKVAAALSGGGRGIVGPLVTAKDYTVSGVKRTKPGEVEIHDHETDIFYVTEGDATFMIGGTIVGAKKTAPGQTRGTDLHGAKTIHLKKGDVITIAAGVPHWFKDVSPSISYLTIKVIK